MTSLFGRMLPLFVGVRRVEDLFTEAVARVFELHSDDICLEWLEEIGAISPRRDGMYRFVRKVSTQKPFVAHDDHQTGSRPDMIIEVGYATEEDDSEPYTEVVMIESKIGSFERQDQLRRYASHLEKLPGEKKTLVYITRAYDPKDEAEILATTEGVGFLRLRWHDFYKFLQNIEVDALTKELMLFMNEQGMSRSHRLSVTDLIALSGMRRAIEILDETIDAEVVRELESLMGDKIKNRRNWFRTQIRQDDGYFISASTAGEEQLGCYLGYYFNGTAEYPVASVGFWIEAGSVEHPKLSALIHSIAAHEGWMTYAPGESGATPETWNELNLASVTTEEDHIAAIKHFFIESIHQLRDELTEFKKENPDLPWNGGG